MTIENQHTPEPWATTQDGGYLVHANDAAPATPIPLVTPFVYPANRDKFGGPTPLAFANARRIVACVNACKGIPTAALERGLLHRVLTEAESLIRQVEEYGVRDHAGEWVQEPYSGALSDPLKADLMALRLMPTD